MQTRFITQEWIDGYKAFVQDHPFSPAWWNKQSTQFQVGFRSASIKAGAR